MSAARIALAPALALAALACPARALAADAPCASSYESAQLLRQRGKLVEARAAALSCTRPACPEVARKDCATWADEIARETPSVVVIAREDGTGADTGARVSVDGAARPEASAGRAFELDPGAHTFRVERDGDEPLEQTITLFQRERGRILRFALRPLPSRAAVGAGVAAPSSPATPTTITPPAPAGEARSVTYVPAAIAAGVSVVAFGASAWLGLSGRSDLSALHTSCAPSCTDDQVDPVRRRLFASDIALGIGAISATAAIYLFLRPPTTSPGGAHLAIAPAPGGGVAAMIGSF